MPVFCSLFWSCVSMESISVWFGMVAVYVCEERHAQVGEGVAGVVAQEEAGVDQHKQLQRQEEVGVALEKPVVSCM